MAGPCCWPARRTSSTSCRCTRSPRAWPSAGSPPGCSGAAMPGAVPRGRRPSHRPGRAVPVVPAARQRRRLRLEGLPVTRPATAVVVGGPGWPPETLPRRVTLAEDFSHALDWSTGPRRLSPPLRSRGDRPAGTDAVTVLRPCSPGPSSRVLRPSRRRRRRCSSRSGPAAGPEADRGRLAARRPLAARGRFGGALAVLHPLGRPSRAGDPPRPARGGRAGRCRRGGCAPAARASPGGPRRRPRGPGLAAAPARAAVRRAAGPRGGRRRAGEGEEAARRLVEARRRCVDERPPARWRPRVRLDRVRGRGRRCWRSAGRRRRARPPPWSGPGRPRAAAHRQGPARPRAHAGQRGQRRGGGDPAGAAELAGRLGALPLVWPARALLGALLAAATPPGALPVSAGHERPSAVAADLPPGVRAPGWPGRRWRPCGARRGRHDRREPGSPTRVSR